MVIVDNVFAYSLAGGSTTDTGTSGNGGTGGTSNIPTTGLIAEWLMEENSGNRLDTSSNSNDLIPSGAIASTAGIVGNAILLDGTQNLSATLTYDFSQDFSVSMWVKITDADYRIFISQAQVSTSSRTFFLDWNIDRFRFGVGGGVVNFLNVESSVFATGQYHHLVGTHDAANKTLSFYIDDSAPIVASYTETMVASTVPIVVGGWAEDSLYIPNGEIDQVRIYDRVLTAAEITALSGET